MKQLCPVSGMPGVVVWNREHEQVVFYRVVAWQMTVDVGGDDDVCPLVIDHESGLMNGEKIDGYLATVDDLLEAAMDPNWIDIARSTLEDVKDPVKELREDLRVVCGNVRRYLRARFDGDLTHKINASEQTKNLLKKFNDLPICDTERVRLGELLEALKGIDH